MTRNKSLCELLKIIHDELGDDKFHALKRRARIEYEHEETDMPPYAFIKMYIIHDYFGRKFVK